METTLVAVTLSSLAVAGLMGVLLLKMLREERRRSDARVALLEDLASAEDARPISEAPRRAERLSVPTAPIKPVATPLVLAAFDSEDLDLRTNPSTGFGDRSPHLFDQVDGPSPWPRRLAVAATVALIVAALGSVWRWSAAEVAPRNAPAAAQQASPRPLELLALNHAYEGATLTISGVVLNPREGDSVSGLEATGVVFDASGVQVASGRAPVDFRVLSAGSESPFVVRIPVTGTVTRYRVGFRSASDHVVAHVDRRNTESVARKQDP